MGNLIKIVTIYKVWSTNEATPKKSNRHELSLSEKIKWFGKKGRKEMDVPEVWVKKALMAVTEHIHILWSAYHFDSNIQFHKIVEWG